MTTRWPTRCLGDMLQIASGQVDPREEPYSNLLHVGGDNIESQTGRLFGLKPARESRLISGKYAFTPDDILYSKIRPNLNKVALPDFAGICSADIYPLRTDERVVCRRFLVHVLRSQEFLTYTLKHSTRTNIPKINREALLAYEFPLPPLAEQIRIAAILDKADGIRRQRREANRHVADLKLSVFQQLFGDPTRNERGWPVVSVADAGAVQLGRQRAPKYQTGEFTRPYLRVANVFEDRIDISDVLSMDFDAGDFERYRLSPGDILLNEGQSTELVGRPALYRGEITDCCFQNTLIRFRSNRQRTEPEYALAVFLEYLRSGAFARISSKTSSVAHLGAARFAAMPFPLPPLHLQQDFCARRRAVRNLEMKQATVQDEAEKLFNAIVYRAFLGEL
jgi:type I restriction enzyme, S subunit